MENKLKVGQTFEVVEVLRDGGYGKYAFNIGGFTIGNKNILVDGLNILSNDNSVLFMTKNEIKPIGKLTITKVK